MVLNGYDDRVDPDREDVKAEAVAGLRLALMSELDVSGALRRCWYRNPMFTGMLFIASVGRRFGSRPDIRIITSFLAGIRRNREEASLPGFPCREAEALVRAALGETQFLEAVSQGNVLYPEIGIAVLEEIFRERSFGPDEWESLLNRAKLALDEGSQSIPAMNLAEDDWFASGIHDSPFAMLDAVLPADWRLER